MRFLYLLQLGSVITLFQTLLMRYDFSKKKKTCFQDADEKDDKLRELTETVYIKPKHALGCDNSLMFVKTSDQPGKKLCCPFCDKLVSKLAKHMETKHNQEPDVEKFLNFPKGNSYSFMFQLLN